MDPARLSAVIVALGGLLVDSPSIVHWGSFVAAAATQRHSGSSVVLPAEVMMSSDDNARVDPFTLVRRFGRVLGGHYIGWSSSTSANRHEDQVTRLLPYRSLAIEHCLVLSVCDTDTVYTRRRRDTAMRGVLVSSFGETTGNEWLSA